MTLNTMTWLATELRAAGLQVVEVPGWQTRTAGPDFELRGMLMHHTASPATSGEFPSIGWMLSDSGFPGPKCNLLLGRPVAGQLSRVTVLTGNRANHAGAGGPLDGIAQDDANPYWCGMEMENDGLTEPWPAAQLSAAWIVCSVVLRHVRGGTAHLWNHKDWAPGRKFDPRGMAIADERAAVDRLLHSPAQTGAGDMMELYQIIDEPGHPGYAVTPSGRVYGFSTGAEFTALRASAEGVPVPFRWVTRHLFNALWGTPTVVVNK